MKNGQQSFGTNLFILRLHRETFCMCRVYDEKYLYFYYNNVRYLCFLVWTRLEPKIWLVSCFIEKIQNLWDFMKRFKGLLFNFPVFLLLLLKNDGLVGVSFNFFIVYRIDKILNDWTIIFQENVLRRENLFQPFSYIMRG